MTGSSSDLDIHFFDLLATAAIGTLMDDTLSENSAPVIDLMMLLHHMRSSHGSSVLNCNVWASWGLASNDSFSVHSDNWPPQLHKDLLK